MPPGEDWTFSHKSHARRSAGLPFSAGAPRVGTNAAVSAVLLAAGDGSV